MDFDYFKKKIDPRNHLKVPKIMDFYKIVDKLTGKSPRNNRANSQYEQLKNNLKAAGNKVLSYHGTRLSQLIKRGVFLLQMNGTRVTADRVYEILNSIPAADKQAVERTLRNDLAPYAHAARSKNDLGSRMTQMHPGMAGSVAAYLDAHILIAGLGIEVGIAFGRGRVKGSSTNRKGKLYSMVYWGWAYGGCTTDIEASVGMAFGLWADLSAIPGGSKVLSGTASLKVPFVVAGAGPGFDYEGIFAVTDWNKGEEQEFNWNNWIMLGMQGVFEVDIGLGIPLALCYNRARNWCLTGKHCVGGSWTWPKDEDPAWFFSLNSSVAANPSADTTQAHEPRRFKLPQEPVVAANLPADRQQDPKVSKFLQRQMGDNMNEIDKRMEQKLLSSL